MYLAALSCLQINLYFIREAVYGHIILPLVGYGAERD